MIFAHDIWSRLILSYFRFYANLETLMLKIILIFVFFFWCLANCFGICDYELMSVNGNLVWEL